MRNSPYLDRPKRELWQAEQDIRKKLEFEKWRELWKKPCKPWEPSEDDPYDEGLRKGRPGDNVTRFYDE